MLIYGIVAQVPPSLSVAEPCWRTRMPQAEAQVGRQRMPRRVAGRHPGLVRGRERGQHGRDEIDHVQWIETLKGAIEIIPNPLLTSIRADAASAGS
jgi:hypothetical protein